MRLKDSAAYERRVMANRGGPANPLSDDELRMKFSLNAEHALTPEAAARLADAIFALDRADGVCGLIGLTQRGD